MNVEIVGIPDNTDETKVCDFLSLATGTTIKPDDLEACHPLPSNDNNKIIVKFSKRKTAQLVLKEKKKFSSIDPRSIDIPSGKAYLNESLCKYYKFLWSKCKQLWCDEWIDSFWVFNGQLKVKDLDEQKIYSICDIADLQKLFPDYDFKLT